MYSSIMSGAVHGIDSYLMQVETDISDGLPSFNMVGFMSGEVREAGERVRVALKNLGVHLPPQRITVNLSPAEIPKRGIVIDLPVCVGLLVCLGYIRACDTENILIAGEVGLNGEVRPVKGILPIVMEARDRGVDVCIIPADNVEEGALVHDIKVIGVCNLAELVEYLRMSEEERDLYYTPAVIEAEEILQSAASDRRYPDLAGVHGQKQAKKVLEIAAAGFHNVLMVGPPGTGKSMLARCLPGIMMPLTAEEALEITRIYSVSGLLPKDQPLITERPFIAPHHSVTKAALIGGGRIPTPGLISQAHLGVLFLDETPEFPKDVLNQLRQPLEDHQIMIRRLGGTYRYPARTLLVAAANPCPCGFFPDMNKCRCTPYEVGNYQKRISGPLLDRIDFRVNVDRVDAEELMDRPKEESSEAVRARVAQAAERQRFRFRDTPFRYNADMDADAVEKFCPLDTSLANLMRRVYDQLQMSVRTYHKTIKIARTIADLEGRDKILERDLMTAVGFRMPGEAKEERRASGREYTGKLGIGTGERMRGRYKTGENPMPAGEKKEGTDG